MSHRSCRILPSAVLLLASLAAILGSCSRATETPSTRETYTIGLVLPNGKPGDDPVVRGLNLFLNHYNGELKHLLAKEFGTSAPNVVLGNVSSDAAASFRGGSHEKAAARAAQFLVKTADPVALIGNPSSDDEHVDHKFYNDNKIPLIALASSGTDVTRNSPWVFSMIYTDEWQGALISAYVKDILEAAHVLVIRGDYMTGLNDSFLKQSGSNGLRVVADISFASEKEITRGRLAGRVRQVQDGYDAVIILAHAEHAVEIVRELTMLNIGVPIVGPDDLSDPRFVNGVKKLPQDKAPKRIIAANPFFFELAPFKASEFIREFRRLYRENPGQSAVYAYDAAYLIVRGLMDGLRRGKKTPLELREAVQHYLLSIQSMEKALAGISGQLYFDKHGAMRRPVLFSQIKEGLFLPEFTQLLPARGDPAETNRWPDPGSDEESRPRVIEIDGVPMKRTAVVYAGVDVEQVSNINLDSQEFEMQGFLWFKWRSEIHWNQKHKFFWNQILEGNEGIVSLGRNRTAPTKYSSFEMRSKFKADYDLRQFPFDTQTLRIDLSAARVGVDEVLFVADGTHLRSIDEIMASKKVLPSGYRLVGIEHFSGTKPFESSLGKDASGGGCQEYSVYRVSLKAQRLSLPYFLKVFLPLFILVGVSHSVFLVPVQGSFSVRMSLASTALLSAIVEHLSQAQSLPNVSYLTRIDYFFVFAYVFMATNIIASIFKERLSRIGAENVARTVNRVLGLVLFFGAVVVFGLLSVPGIGEVWPAGLAAVTILAAFIYCSYLAYGHKRVSRGAAAAALGKKAG
ncbi:MAG: ABC transporter substrate-binding protein [Pseudomonadota bacterium]